jgi:NADPH:quinone reductase-like Zn-dependent oxidoreductase
MTTPFLGGKKVLFPIPTISQEDVIFLKNLAEQGSFKPLIDRSYPLDQIVAAHAYVESGQKTGSVIIQVVE